MAVLDEEIALYEEMRAYLEREHGGAWVLIHQREMVGTYHSYEDADKVAVSRYGRGPCLIRKVGDKPFPLPAAVRFRYVARD